MAKVPCHTNFSQGLFQGDTPWMGRIAINDDHHHDDDRHDYHHEDNHHEHRHDHVIMIVIMLIMMATPRLRTREGVCTGKRRGPKGPWQGWQPCQASPGRVSLRLHPPARAPCGASGNAERLGA